MTDYDLDLLMEPEIPEPFYFGFGLFVLAWIASVVMAMVIGG